MRIRALNATLFLLMTLAGGVAFQANHLKSKNFRTKTPHVRRTLAFVGGA